MWGEHPYALDLPQPGDGRRGDPGPAAGAAPRPRPARRGACSCWSATCPRPDARRGRRRARRLDRPGRQAAHAGAAGPARRPAADRRPPRVGADLAAHRRRRRVPRTDPAYPALQLANLIFGGYFSSRWTENIREDKGYTYGPHSRVDHHVLGSTLAPRRRGRHRGHRAGPARDALRAGPHRLAAGHRGRGRVGAPVRDRHAGAVDGHAGRARLDPVALLAAARARARLDHRAPGAAAADDASRT